MGKSTLYCSQNYYYYYFIISIFNSQKNYVNNCNTDIINIWYSNYVIYFFNKNLLILLIKNASKLVSYRKFISFERINTFITLKNDRKIIKFQ